MHQDEFNKLLAEYDALRAKADAQRRARIDDAYARVPQIKAIDDEIYRLGVENIRHIFEHPDKKNEYNSELKKNISRLQNERQKLLLANNIAPDFDRPVYKCAICEDTGYVNGQKCRCFKQKIIDISYKQSNISNLLPEQNFKTFNIDLYSDLVASGERISPYDNIKTIYHECVKFCDYFTESSQNMLFYGGAGLGKTFLSSCIAKSLIDKGYTVVYMSSVRLFSIYEEYKFRLIPSDDARAQLDRALDADLLIIDDLGTETDNKNTKSYFYDILETRLLNRKKMVISTNLTMKELSSRYSTRFTSRIYEHFLPLRFFGEDIRVKRLADE